MAAYRENGATTWDWRMNCREDIRFEWVVEQLKTYCRKWTFQVELGENAGVYHYQGRLSLKVKSRKPALIKMFPNAHYFGVTSNANRDNTFYVEKSETNVAGPWHDTDEEFNKEEPEELPPRLSKITMLHRFQEEIRTIGTGPEDDRSINLLYDPIGMNGKSTIVNIMRYHKQAFKLPIFKEFRDIMRVLQKAPKRQCYFIDVPRGLCARKHAELWPGLESLKDGHVWDDRYTFVEYDFWIVPHIWVFVNRLPDMNMLSPDRWKMWKIHRQRLVKFDYGEQDMPTEYFDAREAAVGG